MNNFEYKNKFVMNWNKYDVKDWINDVAREKEMADCGDLFENQNIDGTKLWDIKSYEKLKQMGIPSVGLKLTIFKKIETSVGDYYQ